MRTQLVVFSLSRRAQKRLKESVGAVQDYVLLSARGVLALFTRPRYPKELLAQLFKPVPVADAAGRPRVGLGLAIAHKLVTLMGGSIAVESSAGHGTMFRFDLPLARA